MAHEGSLEASSLVITDVRFSADRVSNISFIGRPWSRPSYFALKIGTIIVARDRFA